MRGMGIEATTAQSSIDTLVKMPRSVKTVYGESRETYATDPLLDEILHGIGQGNGYGPIIWAGISSPLIKILRKMKYGVSCSSPITKEDLTMAGHSFVDDTDQIELKPGETDWEQVLNNAQRGVSLWESLLRTTGGAIEPSKTDWVKVKYCWKKVSLNSKRLTQVINCTLETHKVSFRRLHRSSHMKLEEHWGFGRPPMAKKTHNKRYSSKKLKNGARGKKPLRPQFQLLGVRFDIHWPRPPLHQCNVKRSILFLKRHYLEKEALLELLQTRSLFHRES